MLKEVAMNPKRHHVRKAEKPEPEPKPEPPKPVYHAVYLPARRPELTPVDEPTVVEPEWEPIIEKVDPVVDYSIRKIRDDKKPVIQPILEE